MTRSLLVVFVVSWAAVAHADTRPRILVLPLPASTAIDANAARTFDARLLVALDDTRRVVTVTTDEEPECTTLRCLADLGVTENAAFVLSLSIAREADGITVFGTLIDSKAGVSARRIQVSRQSAARLSKMAPAEIVPQIVGAPPGATVVGVAQANDAGVQSVVYALTEQIAALRAFKVLPLDGSDRSLITHRAELAIEQFSIVKQRHQLCTYLDGTLVGTFSITDLATGRVVFTKTVSLAESKRAHFSSREEVLDELVASALADWMGAFRSSGVIGQLAKRR